MKFVLRCLCALCMLFAQAASASDAQIDALLKDYLDSWQTADGAARLVKLQKIWAPQALHESPFARSVGIMEINEEIAGFQKMFPQASVKFDKPKKTGKHLMVGFELRKADGSVAASGYDYMELDDSGRIVKVIGFVK